MSFDFEIWKQAVLRSVDEATDRFDLLVASGLVEADDTLEEAFEKLLMSLQAEFDEEKRSADDGVEDDQRG